MFFEYGTCLEHPLQFLSYFSLGMALVSIWLKRSFLIWANLFMLALLLGTLSARLQIMALMFIGVYAFFCYYCFNAKGSVFQACCWIIVFLLSILLWFHKVPGFSNWLIAKEVLLSKDALPFSLYLNFDKPMIGLFILGFGSLPVLTSQKDFFKMMEQSLLVVLLGILGIIGMSLGLGYVKFDPKWDQIFWIWAFQNLILGCITEEVLFRGFLQEGLSRVFKKIPLGNFYAILLAAIAFSTVHLGSLKYQFLTFVAGLFYGWVYFKTKRIEASILTHFLLNLVHILGFTYPALATGFI